MKNYIKSLLFIPAGLIIGSLFNLDLGKVFNKILRFLWSLFSKGGLTNIMKFIKFIKKFSIRSKLAKFREKFSIKFKLIQFRKKIWLLLIVSQLFWLTSNSFAINDAQALQKSIVIEKVIANKEKSAIIIATRGGDSNKGSYILPGADGFNVPYPKNKRSQDLSNFMRSNQPGGGNDPGGGQCKWNNLNSKFVPKPSNDGRYGNNQKPKKKESKYEKKRQKRENKEFERRLQNDRNLYITKNLDTEERIYTKGIARSKIYHAPECFEVVNGESFDFTKLKKMDFEERKIYLKDPINIPKKLLDEVEGYLNQHIDNEKTLKIPGTYGMNREKKSNGKSEKRVDYHHYNEDTNVYMFSKPYFIKDEKSGTSKETLVPITYFKLKKAQRDDLYNNSNVT